MPRRGGAGGERCRTDAVVSGASDHPTAVHERRRRVTDDALYVKFGPSDEPGAPAEPRVAEGSAMSAAGPRVGWRDLRGTPSRLGVAGAFQAACGTRMRCHVSH